MGVSSGARANPLTGAGRHRLAQVALAHPVRTVILVHLVSRIVAWLVLEVAARGFQNPAGVDTLDPTAVDLLPLCFRLTGLGDRLASLDSLVGGQAAVCRVRRCSCFLAWTGVRPAM